MLENLSTMAGCLLCKIGWHKLDNLLDRDGSFGVDVTSTACAQGAGIATYPSPITRATSSLAAQEGSDGADHGRGELHTLGWLLGATRTKSRICLYSNAGVGSTAA